MQAEITINLFLDLDAKESDGIRVTEGLFIRQSPNARQLLQQPISQRTHVHL